MHGFSWGGRKYLRESRWGHFLIPKGFKVKAHGIAMGGLVEGY